MSDKIKSFLLSNTGLWLIFVTWSLFVSQLWLPRNWGFYGNNDWDLTYSVFEAARKSIMEYGQWPQLNPYSSFGTDFIANPQSTHISIFFIPILLFGTFYGYKLSILCSIIIGLWGAYKFFKLINPDKLIALYASFLFAGLNYFSEHIFRAGHSNVMYFYLVPWVLFFLFKLQQGFKWKYALLPVLILSQMIVGGAPIVFLITAMIVFTWCISEWWIYKNKTIFLPFLLIVISGVIISLWKVWPGIIYWQNSPRLVTDESGISIVMWLQALAGYQTETGNWLAWWEYSLGFNLILLAIIYYYRSNISSIGKWLLLFCLTVWLTLGNTPAYFNIWYPLNRFFPVFSSLRAPSRFGFIAVFGLLVALVYCIKNIKKIQFIYVLLFFAVVGQSLNFNAISKNLLSSKLMKKYEVTSSPTNTVPTPIKVDSRNASFQFLEIQKQNLIMNAYEPLNASMVSDTFYTLVYGAEIMTFSPNKIVLKASNNIINVNLRFSYNWQISGKGILSANHGLIQINNASGMITLTYNNRYVKTGILLSLLFFPLLFLVRVFGRKIRI